MSRFSGRVAVVTGGASGLGRATCVQLAAEGAAVACLDVAAGAAEETVKEIDAAGGRARAWACDVRDPESVRVTVSEVESELGPASVLCNVAGVGRFAHTTELTLEEWYRVVDVNLTGTFLMCQAVLPGMLEAGGGSIVNVSSAGGLGGQPYSAAYCAAKGGVAALTKSLAMEYIRRGIRVNAVAPGGMDTPMLESWGIPEGVSMREFTRLMSPMGYAEPAQVATMVVFLASDEAAYMTGTVVPVDGGLSV